MPAPPAPYEVLELWGQNVDVYDRTQMREYAQAATAALQREVEELRALLIDARDTLCDLDTVYSESLRDRIDAATASKAEVPNV
jgi:hypothetical protein